MNKKTNGRKYLMAVCLMIITLSAALLTGCAGRAPASVEEEESIAGRYIGEYNLKDMVNEQFAPAGVTLESDIMSRFILQLGEDGRFSIDLDTDRLVSSLVETLDAEMDSIVEDLIGEPVTDEVKASIAESAGYDSYDDFKEEVLNSMTEELNDDTLENLKEEVHFEGVYSVDGSDLVLKESADKDDTSSTDKATILEDGSIAFETKVDDMEIAITFVKENN